ncbi:hypothetical protein MCOR22_000612 [Pyricularia oryzae]|uniref:ABC transporter domain-containing protein n=1 Tax=Pyricularia grisea TaxID=148305 RepID=A0ABQ8NYT1_PYRGI|nr:hypothetical protein MCOR33_000841 [Pyricularia grisea]KAI6452829.1 hypothetical protein MCOR22_000612 [Pyricularia oryzae]
MDDRPTPKDTDIPGGFPESPPGPTPLTERNFPLVTSQLRASRSHVDAPTEQIRRPGPAIGGDIGSTSSSLTEKEGLNNETASQDDGSEKRFAPLRTDSQAVRATGSDARPGFERKATSYTEDDIFRALSRRRTGGTHASAPAESDEDEGQEIERLVSRMFGHERQRQSAEEKTRRSGVIFRDLTVKGVGLGATLQPTVGDIFLALPRKIGHLFTKGPRAAFAKPPVRELISHFDGCVRPGELLLVLGRPGSGCSTFLKTFCNQRAGFESVLGDVSYGGVDAKTMARDYRGDIIYNPEEDLNYATLSVKRTLHFALETRAPGKESRLEGETRQDYIREFMRVITKLFWIEHTLDTKVGNEYVRGVSGGERKRVSIAEAMIARASVQGWDNSSKGLDASTAVEYLRSIRAMTNMANTSTAVSLYQAGESLYELADKVLLIDAGKCLYFGPSEQAKQYFIDLGFHCPERWTTADFLTSVTDPHERHVRQGWEDRFPRTPEQFAEAYRRSNIYRANLEDMSRFEAEQQQQVEARAAIEAGKPKRERTKNYEIPFHKQVIACTKRQFLVMIGDKASLLGKWGGLVFQGLIIGSLFFNLPETASGAFPRGGVLFLLLLFNALLALAEQTAAFESKPILLKHKSFSFYRPSAYAIAQTVVDVPLVFIQVVLFTVIIYFMSHLARTASQYFIANLILWLVTMTTYSFFRAISAWCGTLDVATRFTGLAVQILVVYTGYLIPPTSMPVWFGWLRWINWLQYGFECLMSNEFYRQELTCNGPFLVPQGPQAEPQYQGCTLAGSTPGDSTVSGANYIAESFSYTRAHLWRNFGFLWAFFIFFVLLTALGMERMKPNKGGGAITVFKRGQVPKQLESTIETGGKGKGGNEKDEEVGTTGSGSQTPVSPGEGSTEEDDKTSNQVAKNETIFTFRDVNYEISSKGGKRKLLSDVQGYVRPGKLTALMGASGAGKTTLLNTLAQRIQTGTVTGEFLVDGRPLPKSFQRATGFAEQMDIHEPTATVREALQFSALLRQPREVPKQEKLDYCETIIDLLEMRSIAGATIGNVGEGLNTEQRKRLTIGVELASKPELLMFLDEPTSGLDSGAAFNIVRFLRKLADAGQAVLCTIHQPSAILFENFDELLLLKAGGRVVYHGPLGHDSQDLLGYLEGNGAHKCPPNANPAEYMLDAIGAGDPDYKGQDWGDVWQNSKEREARTREIDDMISQRQQAEQTQSLRDEREYAMPLSAQMSAVARRSFVSYWRNPGYLVGKFMLHILTGLFNCFTFFRIGFASIDYQNRLFSVFMTLTICPPLIQQLQPVFIDSRQIFQWRENKAKIYSWSAWVTGAVLAEIPVAVLAGAVYFNCWWWGIFGWRDIMPASSSAFAFLMVVLFELYYVSFGQAVAAFSPNKLLASLLVPLFFTFIISFCGVVVPPAQIPAFWRDWMYWLSPFHYLLEALLGVAVHAQPLECSPDELARFEPPPGSSCEEYAGPYVAQAGGRLRTGQGGMCELCQYADGDQFAASFSVYYYNRWRDVGIFCGFIVFNYAVVYLATWLKFKGRNPLKMFGKRKSG